MPRYYNNRSYRPYRKAKRPTERIIRAGQAPVTNTTGSAYIWTADTPCTITNFKLDVGEESANTYWPVAYALVYVPEGYNVNNLTFPAVSDDLYNPTKMVIISGVCNSSGNEDHKSSRYSRKCSPGDRIALIMISTRPSGTQPTNFELSFTVVA